MNDSVFREDIIPEIVLEGIYVFYVAIVRKGQFNRFSKTTHEIIFNTNVSAKPVLQN